MGYRIQRVAAVVRDVVSDAIANRLSDPRICRLTSVTRVEVSPDLESACVYVSVMGTDAESRRTMQGLASACGAVQGRLAKQLDMRRCPELRFELDMGLKIASQTIRVLDEVLSEDAPPIGSDARVAEEGDAVASTDPEGVRRGLERSNEERE